MAVVAYPGNLQTSQAGNADSTNTIQMKGGEINLRPYILRIVTNAGTTVTINVLGSYDNSVFQNVYYSNLSGAAGDYVKTALVITTATTTLLELLPGQGFSFLKLNQSVNTGMTPTSDLL